MVVLLGGVFGRCLCHEDGALTDRIRALIKETRERSLALSAIWGDKKSATRKTALTWHACILIWNFQPPGLWIKSYFFKLFSLWYFVIAAGMDKDRHGITQIRSEWYFSPSARCVKHKNGGGIGHNVQWHYERWQWQRRRKLSKQIAWAHKRYFNKCREEGWRDLNFQVCDWVIETKINLLPSISIQTST